MTNIRYGATQENIHTRCYFHLSLQLAQLLELISLVRNIPDVEIIAGATA